MSMILRQYSEYRDTEIPWLEEIPGHWKLRRAKSLFQKADRPVRLDDEVVTCFRDGTVTLRRNRRMRGFTESLKEIGYQGVRKGDLVIHAMDAFAGAMGVSDSDGKCSPVYSVCQPNDHVNAYYYAYVLREMARSQWIVALAKGIRERSTDFRFDQFASQHVPVPSLEEQNHVASFLDRVECCVVSLTRAKREQIKLLNEQKQVIINQAVTRGLDPNVRMKPSGVEWIGDVPEHWQMTRLKYLAQFVSGGTPSTSTPSFWNGNIPWVSPKDMKYFEIYDTRDHVTERAIQAGKTALVPAGAVLMVVRSGILQRTIPVAVACREVAINQDLKAIIVDDELLVPEFLSMVVIGNQQALLALWRKQGATVESLEYKWILNTVFPVPPVQEQRAILTVLLPRLMEIEKTIEHVQREIDLLHEYRTRLIADVVTGKLDVRGVELPDIDVSEGLDEWDGEEEIGQEEIIEPEEMDVDEDN